MLNKEDFKYAATVTTVLILGAGYFLYQQHEAILSFFFTPESKPVHVHADFALYINGERFNLTDDRYQSTPESVKHKDMHFHDNNDRIIHRHAPDITLGSFFGSIGIGLSNTCLSVDTNGSFCSDDQHQLRLYVNGEVIPDPDTYVIQEADRILLHYGTEEAEQIAALQDTISSNACIYSGTCPERGTPPPESCGITCEI